MEADLVFDILLYINLYYFPVFLFTEGVVVFAKYVSETLQTPTIGNDASVMGIMVASEFFKLVLHVKLKDRKKGL